MPEHKLSVGNVEVLVLHDNDGALPLNMIFPAVPSEAWAPYRQRYPETFRDAETWRGHFHGYLVRSQGRIILVDTGLGSIATNPGAVAAFAGGVDGSLITELRAAGVRPEELDTVFFTHLHPDHIGWNLVKGDGGPRPTFAKARYIAHLADWDAFGKPEVQGMFPFGFWDETLGPLEKLGVLDLITGERALTPEITAFHTPGHTPGSMSLLITSAGQRAFILGDVFHTPAQVEEPDWRFSFDIDPAVAVQTRRRMIERAESENATITVCHHSGFGRVVRVRGRRYWEALK